MINALLLAIDFINDIVHPKGKICSVAQYVADNAVLQQANNAIAIARKNKIPIVHVKVGFSASYIECPKNSLVFGKAQEIGALQLGQWGTEFHETMDVATHDVILVKHRVSALYATPLATLLSANKIDTVILAGVSTNMAIETLARELHDRDYNVIVVEDACGAATKEIHDASLVNLKRIATVCKVDDLVTL